MNCVVLCDADGNSVVATDENPGDGSCRKGQENEREPPKNVSKVATTFERLGDNKVVESLSEMKTLNKEERSVSRSNKDHGDERNALIGLGDAVTDYEDITDKLLYDHTNDGEFQSTEDLEININNKSESIVKKVERGFDHSSKYPYIKPPRFIKKEQDEKLSKMDPRSIAKTPLAKKLPLVDPPYLVTSADLKNVTPCPIPSSSSKNGSLSTADKPSNEALPPYAPTPFDYYSTNMHGGHYSVPPAIHPDMFPSSAFLPMVTQPPPTISYSTNPLQCQTVQPFHPGSLPTPCVSSTSTQVSGSPQSVPQQAGIPQHYGIPADPPWNTIHPLQNQRPPVPFPPFVLQNAPVASSVPPVPQNYFFPVACRPLLRPNIRYPPPNQLVCMMGYIVNPNVPGLNVSPVPNPLQPNSNTVNFPGNTVVFPDGSVAGNNVTPTATSP